MLIAKAMVGVLTKEFISKRIKCGQITLKYLNSSELIAYVSLPDGWNSAGLLATLNIVSGTPYTAVSKIMTNNNDLSVRAYGSGFVNGHVLSCTYVLFES